MDLHESRSGKANPQDTQAKLDRLYSDLIRRRERFLGYQLNQAFDYSALAPFLNLGLNNLGDPFASATKTLNVREFERDVLRYFAKLWRAQDRSVPVPNSFWGYVTGSGSSEGNLHALWNARDYLGGESLLRGPEAPGPRQPILYFSEEAHYSLLKCARILRLPTFHEAGSRDYPGQCPITPDGRWPQAVPAVNGSVDPGKLAALVDFFAKRGHPPIVVLNLGSAFKGAFDDPEAVWEALRPVLVRRGMRLEHDNGSRQDYWIHIDGALGALYLPYLERAHMRGLVRERGPRFDFDLPFVSSIVASTHKWFGAPIPSAVYLTKEKYRLHPPSFPQYVATPDTTIMGSRNGLSALILWHTLESASDLEFAHVAARCAKLADYAQRKLESAAGRPAAFEVLRAPRSLAILFSRPDELTFDRFSLSGEGDKAHVFIMPHVTEALIDALAQALSDPGAFSPVAMRRAG